MPERVSPVEAAVVAVCLFLLSIILLPGLLLARDAARKQSCQDRLHHLGRAFADYESVHRGLPPRRTGFNDGNPYGGWGGQILPHLDLPKVLAEAEYDFRYDFFDPKNRTVVESQLPAFLCPGSPPERFVQIQSQASTKSLNPDKDTVLTCRAAAVDFITSNGVSLASNGYGINAVGGNSRIGNQRQPMTDNDILPLTKITDGLSNTLLLIEQAGRPFAWRNGKRKPGDGQFGMSPNARGAWAGWGSIAFGAANAETGETPGRGNGTDCSVNCNNWFGIYGFHQNGANVLLCDGSVRFVGQNLDPLTFAYLTIRDDGHLIHQDDF
jgi:prepilin-type processing-associated H-X9-DG protein